MKVATVCTGIGSPEIAIRNLGIEHEIVFGCEIDKYAKETYLANFEPGFMVPDMTKCDWEDEKYYSDLFIGGIPCQAFSLAGKRLGELDPRGLLFFDFYRYVKNQKPKYFIIENVKGLLSDNDGATFRNWINLLGQSENGNPFFFPHEDSLMYNLHWQVLNTKDYGLPQNRERVFLIGIRNDLPNSFVFPRKIPLELRLKDILEDEVDEKYYLSDKMVQGFINHAERHSEKGNGFKFEPKDVDSIANTITTTEGSRGYNNFIEDSKIGYINQDTQASQVYSENGISPTLTSGTHGYAMGYVIGAMRGRNPENTSDRTTGAPTQQMLEINENGTSNCLTSVQKDNLVIEPQVIGFCRTEEAKKMRKENFLKTGKDTGSFSDRNMVAKKQDFSDTILANPNPQKDGLILEPQLTQVAQLEGFESEGRIYDANGISRTIKNGGGGGSKTGWYMVEEEQIINPLKGQTEFGWHFEQNVFSDESICRTLKSSEGSGNKPKIIQGYRIRRLTPLECFRLQGFPDSYIKPVSNSQLYKQAGNSISVPVIQAILKNLLS